MVDGTFFHSFNHNDTVRVWYVGLVCCEKLNAKGTQKLPLWKVRTDWLYREWIHSLASSSLSRVHSEDHSGHYPICKRPARCPRVLGACLWSLISQLKNQKIQTIGSFQIKEEKGKSAGPVRTLGVKFLGAVLKLFKLQKLHIKRKRVETSAVYLGIHRLHCWATRRKVSSVAEIRTNRIEVRIHQWQSQTLSWQEN